MEASGSLDWKRLETHVRRRRRELGHETLAAWSRHLGRVPSYRTLQKLDNAQPVGADTLDAIEVDLGWVPGSAYAILRGGHAQLVDSPADGSSVRGPDQVDELLAAALHLCATPEEFLARVVRLLGDHSASGTADGGQSATAG